MKKVLLVATVQSHIAQFHKPLMRLLKEHGWEVHVAARDNLAEKNGLQLEYADKVYNIPFQRSPFDRRNIAAYKALQKVLKTEHYDVIHCNTPVGGLLTRIAANKYRKTGTKVYYTAHGFHFYKGAPAKNWLIYYPVEKVLSRLTDKLITITREDNELAKEKFHCPVFYLHGVGANSSRFYPISKDEQERQRQSLGVSGRLILSVGELLPNKNQKTAISAMKYILQRYPDAHLLIAGNGPEQENLERLINEEGLSAHVTLLGYTTHLEKYMQVCDVEIACSYREGLPVNVMEAMLCGKPVVASHNRGHNELIQDGLNGYLVDADDSQAFARRICDCLEWTYDKGEKIVETILPYSDTNVLTELKELYGL